jgi:integrase
MTNSFSQKSRHGTVHYFRRRVPVDLREVFACAQLYVSLSTRDRKEALVAAQRLAKSCDGLFSTIRSMSPKPHFEDTRFTHLIALREAVLNEKIEELKAVYAEQESQARREIVSAEARLDQAKSNHNTLHTSRLARLIQSIGPAPNTTSHQQVFDTHLITLGNPAAIELKRGWSIGGAIEEMLGALSISSKTMDRYRTALDHFKAFAGAKSELQWFSQTDFAKYARRVNDHPEWSDATKRLYITVAGRLFSWGAAGHIPNTPSITTRALKPIRNRPAGQDRDAFSLHDLEAIFAESAIDRHKNPHRFWVTVATAFLGCRLNELAQADLRSDFKQDTASGWWYLRISEDVGASGHKKSVKTLAGWRTVPIHPALVRHGFEDFLTAELRAGAHTLFGRYWKPHTPERGDVFDYAHGISKWGTRFRKDLIQKGILASGTHSFFHSMRHAFVNHLANHDVPPEKRTVIVGQAVGGVNATVYSKLAQSLAWKIEIFQRDFEEYERMLDKALK